MKTLHTIVITLIIIGAINWGLVGLFDFNLVSALLGVDSWATNLVYILVGIAGLIAAYTEYVMYRGTHLTPHEQRPVHT